MLCSIDANARLKLIFNIFKQDRKYIKITSARFHEVCLIIKKKKK